MSPRHRASLSHNRTPMRATSHPPRAIEHPCRTRDVPAHRPCARYRASTIQNARQTVNGGVEHAKARKVAIGPLGVDHLHIERATRPRMCPLANRAPRRRPSWQARTTQQSTRACPRPIHRVHQAAASHSHPLQEGVKQVPLGEYFIHASGYSRRDIGTKTHVNTLFTEVLDRRHPRSRNMNSP